MDWSWEVAERDHEIQNPLSAAKVSLVGKYARLGPGNAVFDVACGKGAPAVLLAAEYGCKITGVEVRPTFADEARRRVAAAGLDSLVEIVTGDAADHVPPPESLDAALCLGAAFVWGTIGDAAAALRPALRPGGFVAIGEPYWRQWPLPDGVDPLGYVDLAATAGRLEWAGFALTGLVASSEDDWDRYESLHWRALEEWLELNPDDELRAQHDRHRDNHLTVRREHLGWAIFVGRRS